MSGTVIKLFTFLSLTALLAVCVVVPASDSYADDFIYIGSEEDPESGDVDVDVSSYGKYQIYIEKGSTLTISCGQNWSRITFSPTYARSECSKSSEGLVIFDSSASSVTDFGFVAGFSGDNWTYVYVDVIGDDSGSGSGSEGGEGGDDSGSGDGEYSPVPALIICVVLLIGVLYLIRKVKR